MSGLTTVVCSIATSIQSALDIYTVILTRAGNLNLYQYTIPIVREPIGAYWCKLVSKMPDHYKKKTYQVYFHGGLHNVYD